MTLRDKLLRGEVSYRDYCDALVTLLGFGALCVALPGDRTSAEWRELASEDRHLNNVPLARWDAGHGYVRYLTSLVTRDALRSVTGATAWSLSDSVCVLKATARRYAEAGQETT